jgi:hypothetical protein
VGGAAARTAQRLMFALSLIPLVFGYVVATRVVGEREGHLRLPLAYALGLSCFLFGVNALFHVLSLRWAVLATLGLMVMTAAILWPLESGPAVWPRLGRLEAAVVITLTLTALFRALFWQMKHSDDDFFPHAPLMALYLRDIFPPRNPFYPDQPYLGHYGRDLGISALSLLWGERFFAVQYVTTALNHAMTVLLAYFASRRFLKSPRQAILIVLLVFLGLNPYLRRSLLDVFSNNNTVVNLLLFLNAYLFLTAMRRPRLGAAVMSALCLATYSIVYTTHHGVLLAAFPILTVAMLIRSRRWRLLRFGTAVAILTASLAVSLVQGGTLTDVGHRYLWSSKSRPTDASETALVTQQISIKFPKERIGFTAFDGTFYSLFSMKFLQYAGLTTALLPATLFILFVARRYWALLLGACGAVAILIPATVHFGAYENDTYRFLFLGGLGASAALGAVLGMALDQAGPDGRVPAWGRFATAGLLFVLCGGSVAGTAWALADTALRPDQYFWNAEDWACNGIHRDACDPVDASAARAMRRLVQPGERILTNLYREDDVDFVGQTVISASARAFLTGLGAHVPGDPAIKVGQQYKKPAGFRALAFWATGAPELLDEMRVDWLLVDPSRLSRRAGAALAENPRLHLALRDESPSRGGVREVYRVERGAPSHLSPSPTDVTLLSADLPQRVMAASFVEVPIVVSTRAPVLDGKILVGVQARAGGVRIDTDDAVRIETHLRSAGTGRWAGVVPFVCPLEPGTYEVEIVVGGASVPLKGPDGKTSIHRLDVR